MASHAEAITRRVVVFAINRTPLSPGMLVRLAEALAQARPLGVYPGWRFGIGETSPDMMTLARLTLWSRFKRQGISCPVRFRWVESLELQIYLGNDLSRCLFGGGAFEPNELALLSRALEPGMTFMDVGANEGLFTLLASRLVGEDGKVIAIEPSRREIGRLQRNINSNKLTNVQVVAKAASDVAGSATLQVADEEHAGHNTLGEFVWEGVHLAQNETVPVVTIDHMLSEIGGRVDVMKMDIEGAELKALRGAASTLRRWRPLILMELSERSLVAQGTSPEEVLRLLDQLDYDVFTFDDATGLPRPTKPGEELSANIVAMHRERTFGGVADA